MPEVENRYKRGMEPYTVGAALKAGKDWGVRLIIPQEMRG